MLKPLSLWIGLRYTRAKRRNHFISLISAVSFLGIALGVAALVVVISVMNGFESELRGRILGMISHATIAGFGGDLEDWQDARRIARDDPRVLGAAPYVEREAMLQGRRVSGALVRGIDPELEPEVSEIHSEIVLGDFASLVPGQYGIILGAELAQVLGVSLNDSVLVYAPETRPGPTGILPTVRRFTVVGVFQAGMHDYDRGLSVIHMADAQRLFRMQGVTGLRLKLDDLFSAWSVARDLSERLDGFHQVEDWTRKHSNFFRAVRTEKLVMFVILSLIVAVAAFNLVSTLVMLVTDKQADIAILRTLGLGPGQVMGVFMVQGLIVGLVGTALGLLAGVSLAQNIEHLVPWLERVLGFEAMPADIYYINQLPSEMRWEDVGTIAGIAVVFSVIATLYPAWRASRVQPAEALRYE